MAIILQPTTENLRKMREFLCFGGLVGVPTETVYGLAANAFDPTACSRIFEVKQRPTNDPLICHVSGIEQLESICVTNDLARLLTKLFWPGPLTLVLPKRDCIPSIVTAGLGSVAVRCSAHPDFHRLIENCDFPIAAPSANPFAYISPTTARHVDASLGKRIDYILDGGPCSYGVESTILDVRDSGKVSVLRHGALPIEKIETAIGQSILGPIAKSQDASVQQIAPGALPKHYSPRAKLELRAGFDLESLSGLKAGEAALLLAKPANAYGKNVQWLSQNGRLEEIAATLYAKMRELDDAGYQRILVEEAPELGLGMAINDRLRRASY